MKYLLAAGLTLWAGMANAQVLTIGETLGKGKAGLLLSEKEGRNRKLYFNCVPIQMIYDRWTTEYSALWASRLTEVKYRVEAKEMSGGRK